MDIDKIDDINILKQLLKNHMVRMLKTVTTPTHIYKKDEYYFFYQDEEGIFIYYNTPDVGLQLSYDEALEIIC